MAKQTELPTQNNLFSSAADTQVSPSWFKTRSVNRKTQQLDLNVRTSLQQCPLDLNLSRLEGLLKMTQQTYRASPQSTAKAVENKKAAKLEGLIAVLRTLLGETGYLSLDAAYHIYCGYFHDSPDKDHFRDTLLDPEVGLRVSLIIHPETSQSYVVLDPGYGLAKFFVEILSNNKPEEKLSRMNLDPYSVNTIINSMDTEYDRSCAKVLLSADHSKKDLYNFGLKPSTAGRLIKKVVEQSQECENAKAAAADMVQLRYSEKIKKCEQHKQFLKHRLSSKREIWSPRIIGNYEEKMEVLEERIQKLFNIKTRHNKYNERQLKQAIKRTADRLIEENRVKRRRLGQGAHRKLDDEDESFVARCIENETSAHGRRHDKVLYTHKRVKKVNLLGIVNYNHIQRGLPLIKSASTVYNRGKAGKKSHRKQPVLYRKSTKNR